MHSLGPPAPWLVPAPEWPAGPGQPLKSWGHFWATQLIKAEGVNTLLALKQLDVLAEEFSPSQGKVSREEANPGGKESKHLSQALLLRPRAPVGHGDPGPGHFPAWTVSGSKAGLGCDGKEVVGLLCPPPAPRCPHNRDLPVTTIPWGDRPWGPRQLQARSHILGATAAVEMLGLNSRGKNK